MAPKVDAENPDQYGLIPQSNFLGYGMELADALSLYHQTLPSNAKRKQEILKDFATWMQNAPYADNLCFADIYFFNPDTTTSRDSLSLIITPKRGENELTQYSNYLQVLSDFWGKDQEFAIGPHQVFLDGLTVFSDHSNNTRVAVNLDELEDYNKSNDRRETGLLYWDLNAIDDKDAEAPYYRYLELVSSARFEPSPLYHSVSNNNKFVACDAGGVFKEQKDQQAYTKKISKLNIFGLWLRWKKMHRKHRERLPSSKDKPVRWLIAMPVGHRKGEYPYRQFSGFALVFLGFDESLDDIKQVKDATRYVLLHLYESNATAIVSRKSELVGQSRGTEEAMRGFAHQIKSVGFAAGEGWLVKPEQWDFIRNSFKDQSEYSKRLDEYRVAPVPRLYTALRSKLFLWSLSYKPDDLFQRSDDIPSSLEELAQLAWGYAIDSDLVGLNVNKNFSSSTENIKVALNDVSNAWMHDDLELREIDCTDLRIWKITRGFFADSSGRLTLETNNEPSYKELSGLLRIFVVVCENFLAHAVNISKLVVVMKEINDELLITCKNDKCEMIPSSSPVSHLGFRGIELIRYLCRAFLGSLQAQVLECTASDADYSLSIRLQKPNWIIKRG